MIILYVAPGFELGVECRATIDALFAFLSPAPAYVLKAIVGIQLNFLLEEAIAPAEGQCWILGCAGNNKAPSIKEMCIRDRR